MTDRQEMGTQTERHMFCHHICFAITGTSPESNLEEEIFVKKYANTSLDNLIFHLVSPSSSRSCVNCNFIVGWCEAGGVCRNR